MYEDAVQYCDIALEFDKDHVKTSLIKAKSLAFLFKFEESITIFKHIKFEK